MATLESIQARIATLQARAEALVVKQSSSVLEKIRGLMEKHGITTADIDAHVGGKGRGRKPRANAAGKQASAVAKYRDPKTGATWSGHGRAPAWIAGAKNRARFLAMAIRRTRRLRQSRRRRLEIMCVAPRRRSISTRKPAQPGVVVVGHLHGWLAPKTGRSS